MTDQEQLKSLFLYGTATGNFYRKVAPCNSVKVGDRAGTVRYDGYTYIRFQGKPQAAHRLAWLFMYGSWPKSRLDHINGDKSDNRIANLRLVTQSQNQLNRKRCSRNSTGIKGVAVHSASGKYQVTLTVDGKKKHFGLFEDLETAELVARGARVKYHGEYCNHGEPVLWDFDEERMDIIGQNGNDGEHYEEVDDGDK